jgi:hypothetical protein
VGGPDALTGNKRRSPRGAALLAVRIGEPRPLVGDPVDVRRPVAHQSVAVTAEVRDPDVIAPDNENVRLLRLSHRTPSGARLRRDSGAVAHLSEKEGYLPSSAVGGVSDPVISSTRRSRQISTTFPDPSKLEALQDDPKMKALP